MTRSLSRTSPSARRDRGAALPMVLVFFVVVGFTLTATLTFAKTLLANRPPINQRNARVEAVRSAMRMAIQFQRDRGVGDCFQNNATFVFNPGTPEEVQANVACSIGPPEDLANNYFREGGDAFALITTVQDGTAQPITGTVPGAVVGYPAPMKVIEGNVFVAGGDVTQLVAPTEARGDDVLVGNQTDGTASQLVMTRVGGPRYEVGPATLATCDDPLTQLYFPTSGTAPDGTAHGNTPVCDDVEWTERAGVRESGSPAWTYPLLPNIPPNRRPAFNPRDFGPDTSRPGNPDCFVVFPGRYDQPLDFDDGATYYLPSGLFHLTEPMTVSNGSKVVAGQGREPGCEVDSTVLLDPRTVDVEATSVTGRGVTFLLDGNARIDVTDGELYVNRRISTPSTRGSEGVAIRSVQTAPIATPELAVPEDQVITGLDSDGNRLLEPASTYSVVNDFGATLEYTGISVADVNTPLVDVHFNGPGEKAFVVDGTVFVPQGMVDVEITDQNYEFAVDGGITATRLGLDVSAAPTDPDDWYLGVDASPLLRRVQLEATATTGGKTARSVAIFQVNSVGNYAINSWVVDPNGSSGGWSTGGTTGGTSTGGTTGGTSTGGTGTGTGGTSTGGTTGGTGTATGTTGGTGTGTSTGGTGTGTTGGTGTGTSTGGTGTGTGTTGGGAGAPCSDPTKWAATYWDNTGLAGAPAEQRCENDVDFDWGAGGPAGTDNLFSARWTKTIDVTTPGWYDFTVGADDGVRLTVDGIVVHDAWVDGPFSTAIVPVDLTAGPHDVEVEYYENFGDARVVVDWAPGSPPCAADQPRWFGQYYDGTSLSNFEFDQEDDDIDFDWGGGSPNRDVLGNDTYSIRWTRTVNFPAPGEYEFTVGSDDGSRLFVNGTQVINNWRNQSYPQSIKTAVVDIQDHCQVELEFRYYERRGDARVSLDWQQVNN